MQPKFSVGEVVILQSVDCPALNGETTVLMIVHPGEIYKHPFTGRWTRSVASSLGYVLNIEAHAQFHESALRKRHTPGDYSFEDLKTVLHLPVTREEMRRVVREKCNG